MPLLEPHRGHVAAPLSRRDIEDICWLRATIAEELAAAAAERITDDDRRAGATQRRTRRGGEGR